MTDAQRTDSTRRHAPGGPLQRSKKDLVATAAVTGLSLLAVGVVWFDAPIRHSELQPAASEFQSQSALVKLPNRLDQAWTSDSAAVPDNAKPLTVDGVVVTGNQGTVRGLNPTDGSVLWTYERDKELCSLSTAFGSAVATYRNSAGCGDVTQIAAKSGEYKATRSSDAPDRVVPISSNDRVGTVSPERVEIWRSDMVRTVEYGDKDAKQEPDMQPHEDCTIDSALTRKELLAVLETCPEQPNNTMLRLQEATPSDSRKPKIKADIAVPSAEAELVAIGQNAAAVYVPGTTPRLISYDDTGKELARIDVKPSPLVEKHRQENGAIFSPQTADLPHHMTWFDGQRLYLFNPANLSTEKIFEDALGTGVALDNKLVYPVKNGIAVGNWEAGTVERVVPVDRQGYEGPVSLVIVGDSVVEKRGDTLVGLRGA